MSSSFGCKCEERSKPVQERNWMVTQRNCNHSAFNGYHRTRSDYSTVRCGSCGNIGRTKAGYVVLVPDMTEEQRRDWWAGGHRRGTRS